MDITIFIFFALGLVAIIKGSDWFIDSVIWIAKVLRIPDFVVGATLVSLCTTLPEAIVSVSSSLKGNTNIALGNALGSIACNIGFILGISIIFSRPIFNEKKSMQKKSVFLLTLIAFITIIGFVYGQITRTTGVFLLCVLVFYMFNDMYKRKKTTSNVCEDSSICKSKKTIINNIVMFVIGLALTLVGANLLVVNGIKIATFLSIPEIIIGLTLTAFGTSLPEFMTAITAMRKKAHGISAGNILGASILNIILVIGLSSTILPIPFNTSMLSFHIPFIALIVASVVLLAFVSKNVLRRRGGILLLSTYAVYVFLMIT